MSTPSKYNGDGSPVLPQEVTPQSVYDTLLEAATRNVSLHLHAAQVRMLAQLVQEILARVRTLEEAAARDADEITQLSMERDTLEHDKGTPP